MPSEARARRIGERIREEMADLLHREIADPRVGRLTVTDVEVDRELALATVFVIAADAADRADEILQVLDGARGFLRSELARRIPLRSFPRLRFRWDTSVERGSRIDEVLEELRRQEAQGKETPLED
jgi:ribosome-binding factor A